MSYSTCLKGGGGQFTVPTILSATIRISRLFVGTDELGNKSAGLQSGVKCSNFQFDPMRNSAPRGTSILLQLWNKNGQVQKALYKYPIPLTAVFQSAPPSNKCPHSENNIDIRLGWRMNSDFSSERNIEQTLWLPGPLSLQFLSLTIFCFSFGVQYHMQMYKVR